MAYDSARGVTVLFGGLRYPNVFDDTWEWDGTTWTQLAIPGPPPRQRHGMAYDTARGVTVFFRGDTWELGCPCDPCDTNCDGSVDLTDVEPFIALLLGDDPCDTCAGDANNDGSIDLTDVEAFIACLLG